MKVFFLFFFYPFPFHHLAYQVPFAVGLFFSFFLFYAVRRGSGVLPPATHAHPLSSPFSGRHNTNTTTHNIHPAWDSNSADLSVVSEECRSSFHHPTVSP
jgi:hypothetical protein